MSIKEIESFTTDGSLVTTDDQGRKVKHFLYTDALALAAVLDDATSDPLIDADSAADGVEESVARKDHVHPKHHAKYTDTEAVTQAKTVKLDDFTAPDDNTDLDATGTAHGLFPKLDHDKLDDIAAGADVTGSNPPQAHGVGSHTDVTRVLFLPANEAHILSGFSTSSNWYGAVAGLANSAEPKLPFTIKVPDDFVSFTKVEAVWASPAATGNMYWKTISRYGASTESQSVHSDSPAYGTTPTGGANIINVQEPANPLTLVNLGLDDVLALYFLRDGSHENDTLNQTVSILGLLFAYVAHQ